MFQLVEATERLIVGEGASMETTLILITLFYRDSESVNILS